MEHNRSKESFQFVLDTLRDLVRNLRAVRILLENGSRLDKGWILLDNYVFEKFEVREV
jgi:hypothetical protein